jgi:hypothetical protein
MTTQRKSPQTHERLEAQIEAPTGDTSVMNMPRKRGQVNNAGRSHDASMVDPEEFFNLYARLETVQSNLDAIAKVFGLIAEQSTEFDVVQPLAEAGQLLAGNVKGAVNGVLLRMGVVSGRLVRAGLA